MNRRKLLVLSGVATVFVLPAIACMTPTDGEATATQAYSIAAPAASPTCPLPNAPAAGPGDPNCPVDPPTDPDPDPTPPAPPARWEIRETLGGKCLSVNPADPTGHVIISACGGTAQERWIVAGNKTIINVATNKCLTVRGGANDGAQVGVDTCANTVQQHWYPQYTKALMGYGGRALDLEQGPHSVEGSEAHMWTYQELSNQFWNVVKVQ